MVKPTHLAICNPAYLALVVLLVVNIGCGKESKWSRVPLNGAVRLDDEGTTGAVSFVPAKGTAGPSTTAGIDNGRYRFDRRNGPVVGTHEVTLVSAADERDSPSPVVFVDVGEEQSSLDLDFKSPAKAAQRPRAEPETSSVPTK